MIRLLQDIVAKIREKHYSIEDCSYEEMIRMLHESYTRHIKSGNSNHYRKILPPDDKPVELSICSKHSQELFIQPGEEL